MRRFASILHLDTSVLLPLLDKNGKVVPRDQTIALRRFRYRLPRENKKVKISAVALGEVLKKVIETGYLELIEELKEFALRMGENLELCYFPRFRNSYYNFNNILQQFLDADDYLRDRPADAIILVIATLDREADILYTMDNSILLNRKIKNVVNNVRKVNCFKRLKISSPPGR